MMRFLKLVGIAALSIVAIVVLILGGFLLAANLREKEVAEKAAPRGGRYVDAGDVRIFLQERGPTTGPLVFFVHGTGAWSEAWLASLERLGGAGYHTIAIDLPPFGYSARPASRVYDKRVQGERIVAALKSLGDSPAIIVGHSFGAAPAVEAAFLAPDRFTGLVLVDPALSIAEGEGPAVGARREIPLPIAATLALEPVRDALIATFLTNPMMTRRLLTGFIDDPARATDQWVEIYRRPQTVQGTTSALADWIPQLVATRQVERSEVAPSYRDLKPPLEAIWGEKDTITPIAQGERLVKLVREGNLTRLPGIGHIPQIEDNVRFNDALEAAVRRISSRSAPEK
jgi:pimeloyl-ACP methyl ester carboxylesterase